mmetsp:Transcript_30243/g.76374  ORF Transcript_30243/g.76374 Transcript_30243/m.76374 type:complete len:215 (-) Transcript_30243:114-758(-)
MAPPVDELAAGAGSTPSGLREGGVPSYMVAQGLVFIKHAQDPTSQKIVRAKRSVGFMVYCTGRSWTGPLGATWAEVDDTRSPGECSWVLVQGPGFGVVGPLLVDPLSEEHASQRIAVRWCRDPPIFECVMPKTATIGDVVNVFCARTGLNKKETILTKSLPKKAPNGSGILLPMDYTSAKDVLFNEMTIRDAQITDTLNLVYVGHFEEDYHPTI